MKTITVKYATSCADCGAELKKGARALYVPKTRTARAFCTCPDCAARYWEAEAEARDYEDRYRAQLGY